MTTKRTILVTGGNRGIGLEICRQLAKRGAKVWLGARDLTKAETAARSLGSELVHGIRLDLTDESSMDAALLSIAKEDGHLDVLINNAGIFDKQDGSALEITIPILQRTLATNVFGPLLICQKFIPMLRHSSDARIVNVSSGMGSLSEMGAGYAAYRMSKTALNALTGILAAELKDSGISITSMCPGWVKTDMGGPNAPRTVEQGADTAVWLALDSDRSVNGKFVRDRAIIPW